MTNTLLRKKYLAYCPMFSETFFCVSLCFSISKVNCTVCLHKTLCREDFSHIQKTQTKFRY